MLLNNNLTPIPIDQNHSLGHSSLKPNEAICVISYCCLDASVKRSILSISLHAFKENVALILSKDQILIHVILHTNLH